MILAFSACSKDPVNPRATPNGNSNPTLPSFSPPEMVGTIDSESITESSGLVASRCNKDVLWTHNDSGDKNYLFALDMSGKLIGRWRVKGAENKDWEDIATIKDGSGRCFLYIGDIGDNGEKRQEMSIYRVEEPKIGDGSPSRFETAAADRIRFRYPDGYKNAETLLVHPFSGDIYVITKTMIGEAEVYKIPPQFNGSPVTALKVSDFSVPAIPEGLVTGGDISPDGRHVAISDYFGGYEFDVPADSDKFDEVWKRDPVRFDLGERQQGEGICYSADGTKLFATSEKANSPLIMVRVQ